MLLKKQPNMMPGIYEYNEISIDLTHGDTIITTVVNRYSNRYYKFSQQEKTWGF